jgi:hypothetical protein
MADPLYSAAADVAPVKMPTQFFDPSEALGITQKYGMSYANRGFAEDALKSANEIDKAANYDPVNRRNDLERHNRAMVLADREDLAYAEKKEFEDTLGTFLIDMAKLKDDPNGPEKAALMFQDPAAAENPSVKAMFNVLNNHWETERSVRNADDQFAQRMQAEIATNFGVDPTVMLNEDGKLDWGKVAKTAAEVNQAKLNAEAGKVNRDTERDVIGKDSPLVDIQYREQADQVIAERTKSLYDSAAAQNLPINVSQEDMAKLLERAPDMSKSAFVAQVLDLGKTLNMPPNLTETERQLFLLKAQESLPTELKTMVAATEDLWGAAYIKARRPKAPASAYKTQELTPEEQNKKKASVDLFFDGE